jgi:hypothetical protein
MRGEYRLAKDVQEQALIVVASAIVAIVAARVDEVAQAGVRVFRPAQGRLDKKE